SVAAVAGLQLLFALAPLVLGASAIERLTTLFIYGILALMWNALAGYGGLVSVGQQAFFGLGAYAVLRLADFGISVFPAMLLAAVLVAVVSLPIALVMLRLRTGEFAVGMWVVAELAHLLVNLDSFIQGETGTSLVAMLAFAPQRRRAFTYWAALATMVALAWIVFALLRARLGTAAQAIRDNEEAASSVGVPVAATKRTLFVLSAFGCAAAGALWVATTISFQPKTYFSVQWSAYMIFMVLVGGIGTFEGPVLGAVLFFAVETLFGASGVWYMIGLGATALIFSLLLPRGIWGTIEQRFDIRLLPVGYFLRSDTTSSSEPAPSARTPRQSAGP
ncbi:MAG TPA: branched-chain amino acid ABC transporter permease, partial [Burkholderiaceae bacterium]|nr:branched-chain amino acid ABC transporter permease [Burkholderiaceae bacterium]